jgi:cytochrome oxidase Cu insertion factor (SCO1/SenC/PrrC family)
MHIRPWFATSFKMAALMCVCAIAPMLARAQQQTTPITPTESVSAPVTNAAATSPSIVGTTLEKKAFNLATLKGKVVLVMFWSTNCAVCRDKMPEFRENVQGWADKPFEMVLVSVDPRMADIDSYNAIINKSVPIKQRFTQLWTGSAGYKDNLDTANLTRTQLPAALLIDKEGKLVGRFNGRIPAEVWDKISDLL